MAPSSDTPSHAELATQLLALRVQVDAAIERFDAQDIKAHTELEIFRSRLEALEKRFSAMEARMTHIDTLLMEMQGEVRRMAKGVDSLTRNQTGTTETLNELREMMKRILDMHQPRVTIPEPPVAGG